MIKICDHRLTVISVKGPNLALSTVLFCSKCKVVVGWSTKDEKLLKSDYDIKISGSVTKLTNKEKEDLR